MVEKLVKGPVEVETVIVEKIVVATATPTRTPESFPMEGDNVRVIFDPTRYYMVGRVSGYERVVDCLQDGARRGLGPGTRGIVLQFLDRCDDYFVQIRLDDGTRWWLRRSELTPE